MSSAVAELDGYLKSMLSLKPPGVSGSKIGSITQLCTANVQVRLFFDIEKLLSILCFIMLTCPWQQSESVLIQKIFTHFKRTPGTHKLGVLYVVDSVTRQWVDAARKAGQPPGSAAPDGTFAAGVNRVTELLPVLMTDILNNSPEDQKVRSRTNITEIYSISQNPRPVQARTRRVAAGSLYAFEIPLLDGYMHAALASLRIPLIFTCPTSGLDCLEFFLKNHCCCCFLTG